ncbi:MAG: hypothetical protein P8P98_02345, partial [Emcibacteraceae bacterium]|nr:hypothetical protein [Emcibacteraceae bacterium]
HNKFYDDCVKDYKKLDLLKKDFLKEVNFDIWRAMDRIDVRSTYDEKLYFYWYQKEKILRITLDKISESSHLDALNNDEKLNDAIQSALLKVYRYDGKFEFEDGIPF